MKCFKWGTKKCQDSNIEEKCKLYFQDEYNPEIEDFDSNGQTRVLQSPGFTRKHRGAKNRHFCVYNVSLNCSGHHTELYTTEDNSRSNTWETRKCADYVKFYTNSLTESDEELCGENFGYFRATLNSNSFLAILWTDTNKSFGKFQIVARCGSAIIPPPPQPPEVEDIETC